MVVGTNVTIPTLPLFTLERSLTLLEPCVLEKFKYRKENSDCSQAIFFSRPTPIFDRRGERAR